MLSIRVDVMMPQIAGVLCVGRWQQYFLCVTLLRGVSGKKQSESSPGCLLNRHHTEPLFQW